MRRRSDVFGEVAGAYDEVRPGYPDALAAAVLAYAGGGVTRAVEVGAGTGKGTEPFVRRGLAVHCVEADPRMASVLRRRFAGRPQVSVEVARFADWCAPAGGVPLLLCAQAWHFMGGRRCASAHAALAPGGVLAVFGHDFWLGEDLLPVEWAVYGRLEPQLLDARVPEPAPPGRHWQTVDVASSGLFADVSERRFAREVAFPTVRYLALKRTFSPVRMLSRRRREALLGQLGAAVDGLGGVARLRLETTLTLGRRG